MKGVQKNKRKNVKTSRSSKSKKKRRSRVKKVQPKKRRSTRVRKVKPKKRCSRVKKVKGKGLLGALVRGTVTAIKTGARAGVRGGLKLARNPNTWKTLGKAAVTQAASVAANEAANKIIARQKRPLPDWYYRY